MFQASGLCENSGAHHKNWISARLRKLVATWRCFFVKIYGDTLTASAL